MVAERPKRPRRSHIAAARLLSFRYPPILEALPDRFDKIFHIVCECLVLYPAESNSSTSQNERGYVCEFVDGDCLLVNRPIKCLKPNAVYSISPFRFGYGKGFG